MKKMLTNFKGIAISLLFVTAACQSEKKQVADPFSAEVIAVKIYPVQPKSSKHTIAATGLLSTQYEALYSFKTPGVIDRIFVEDGESFSKGKLLASQKLTEIESGEMQAKLGLEKAERDYARVQNLYIDSVATLEQLQNTKTALEIAQKQMDLAAFNKKYAYIYANGDGFVRKKLANQGEVVGGGTPVLAINEQNKGNWDLKVGLSDKDWAMVAVGNRAEVVLDAFPNYAMQGRVFRKSLAADQGTGSFQVEVSINVGELNPAVGMFGKVLIETDKSTTYTPIPYEALIEADGKQAYVFVPMAGGKVHKQPIVIESFNADEVRVKSGLENTEALVLTNAAFLNENSSIKISN